MVCDDNCVTDVKRRDHTAHTGRIDHGAGGEGDGGADEDADEAGAKSHAHHGGAGYHAPYHDQRPMRETREEERQGQRRQVDHGISDGTDPCH